MLFGGRKMKHKKQKKMKKAGHILLAVFAVVIGTLGVLLFTSERWMRKTWPNLSMEELVYQLKAPIAGTSHDLLMSYVCSSALIAAAALILLILVSIFLREKRKAHVAFGLICIAAGAASIVYSINDVWAALDVKDYLKNQSLGNVYNSYAEDIEEKIKNIGSSGGSSGSGSGGGNDRDEYFEEAARFIIDKDKASIGMLQRVLKIGFNRAARIMDQLCEYGVVGEEEGTKPRKVLMSMEQFEQLLEEI